MPLSWQRATTRRAVRLAGIAAAATMVGCGADHGGDRTVTYAGHSRAATLVLVGPTKKGDAEVWDLSLRFTRAGAAVRRKAVRVGNPASSDVYLLPSLSVFCLSDHGLSSIGIQPADLRKDPLIVHFVDLPKAGRWICGLRDTHRAHDRPGESRATYISNSLLAATLTRR